MCDQKACSRRDEAIASLIGRDCGDKEHWCKGAEMVLQLTQTIQQMQRQIDWLEKRVDLVDAAEGRDHKQIERCREALFLSAKKEFEKGV